MLPYLVAVSCRAFGSEHNSSSYSIDLASPRTAFHHAWEECVGSGHASLTLRQDWRAQLTRCRAELGFKRTRFHGLLDDDMSISIKEGVNSYVNLDSVIDFHDTIGMVPLFELRLAFGSVFLSAGDAHWGTHLQLLTMLIHPVKYCRSS